VEHIEKYVEMIDDCEHEKEFHQIIVMAIQDRWRADFPSYVVRSAAKDRKAYETALIGPGKFISHILNAVDRTDFTRGGYYIENYHKLTKGVDTAEECKRLIHDILACPDLRIWLIETIGG